LLWILLSSWSRAWKNRTGGDWKPRCLIILVGLHHQTSITRSASIRVDQWMRLFIRWPRPLIHVLVALYLISSTTI
jgi:hypothetical protein